MNGIDPKKESSNSQISRLKWGSLIWLPLLLIIILGPWLSRQYGPEGTQMSYSSFRHELEASNVASVTVQAREARQVHGASA